MKNVLIAMKKMLKPYKHQEKFAKGYKDKALLAHECGSGKSVCACLWLKDGRDADALVICPLRVILKWQNELKTWGTKATVVSKEKFKKVSIKKWSAIVVDEADEFGSPLFTRKRSQLSGALYNLVKTYPEVPIILLSGTPVRSVSWNLHTLLCFMNHYIDFRKWRDHFFTFERRPYLPRPAWLPKPDWRQRIRPLIEKYADIVLLKDCVGDLPPVAENIVKVPFCPLEGVSEWEPAKAFVEEHRNEQKMKPKEITKLGGKYRKIVVVAHYVEQVESLAKELSKEKETFMLHGGVKNQEEIIKKAQTGDDCFFIVQASLGVGYDLDSFSCVVFASMSYKVRDYIQFLGRVRRIHNLHPVIYYYLLAGRCDNAVFKTIKMGLDFVPSHWDLNEDKRTNKKISKGMGFKK